MFGERYRDAIETAAEAEFVREWGDFRPFSEQSDLVRENYRRRARAGLLAATTEIPCPNCHGHGELDSAGDYCFVCRGSAVLRVLPTNGDE